ncbi:MAG: transcriptional activator protein [Gemmatimonadetes bacterium]|nr:transcriptional activator protein [Gemmatimonadota bacterium]
MTLHLRTLGQTHLSDEQGVELRSLLTQPKRLALLVYLASAYADGRMCRRDSLLAMFWPESDDERARGSLRQAIHFIKQVAGSEVVVTRGADEVGLAANAVQLDAARLDELAASGRHAEAVELFQGDFLDGFFLRGTPTFERWVDGERLRLRRRAADSAWLATEQLLSTGDAAGARKMAERALALSSDNETAVRRFITLLSESGDRAAALAVYQSFASQMAEEYGVAPSPETRALIDALESARPFAGAEPVTVAAPPSTSAHAPQVHSVAARPNRRWRLQLAAAALVVLLGAGFLAKRLSTGPAAVSDPNRLVVLPFVVRGAENLRYLADGLPMLLSTRLDGAGPLRTVDARALLVYLASNAKREPLDPERANAVAERFGAQLYVLGNIVGTGDQLQFSASLFDRAHGNNPVAHTEATGREVDLMNLVDKLASELLAARYREVGGAFAETAARTTTSLPALKAWLAGEAELTRGRYGPSMAALRDAIAADSNFAMAHFQLAVAADWAGVTALVNPETERAVKLSEHLSPSSRLVLQAFSDGRRGNYAAAAKTLRGVLVEQPSASEAWYSLGEVLFHGNPPQGRPLDVARDAFEQTLRLDPHNFPAAVHLARIAATRGDKAAVDRLSAEALANDPDGIHRGEVLLLRALVLRDAQARRQFLASPMDLGLLDALWRATEYSGSLALASDIADTLVHKAPVGELRGSLYMFLAHAAMGRERFDVANRYIDSMAVYAPQSAAATRLVAAMHPALAASARPALLVRAIKGVSPLPAASASHRMYAGFSRPDTIYSPLEYDIALARLATGDSSRAKRLVATTTAERTARIEAVRVMSVLATDAGTRKTVLAEVAQLDSIVGASYVSQNVYAPRALYHLAIARVLEAEGRFADAEARLHAVPEDFGFNLAFLGEVQRRRAALLERMGRPKDAVAARQAAAEILR